LISQKSLWKLEIIHRLFGEKKKHIKEILKNSCCSGFMSKMYAHIGVLFAWNKNKNKGTSWMSHVSDVAAIVHPQNKCNMGYGGWGIYISG